MTAINIVLQPDAAYILSDAAFTAEDGTLLAVRQKVTTFPQFRTALTWSGFGPVSDLEDGIDRIASLVATIRPQTQRQLLEAVPSIVKSMHAENITRMPAGCQAHTYGVALFGVFWSEGDGEPQAFTAHSDAAALGPGYRPYSIARLLQFITAPAEGMDASQVAQEVFGRHVEFSEPGSFHPEVDGLALLEAQRHFKGALGGWCDHGVGGFAHLAKVTADDVSDRILKVWPDRVGQIIDPFNIG